MLHPICGNGGLPEHSETCDDGNTMAGDGCDSRCRAELRAPVATETEPNDEASNANMVQLNPMTGGVLTVRAALGGRCDFDEFGLTVPANGSIRATVLDGTGSPCPAMFPTFHISVLGADGMTNLGTIAPATGTSCPQIDAMTPLHTIWQRACISSACIRRTTSRRQRHTNFGSRSCRSAHAHPFAALVIRCRRPRDAEA